MECIFCKIASGDANSLVVYEDDSVLASLDINPLSPGHTLVIPKKHVETILDLSNGEVGEFFVAVKRVTEKINITINPEGFTLGINQGRAARNSFDHLHFHIIPRWQSDTGGSIHDVVSNPPKESLEEIYNKIKD